MEPHGSSLGITSVWPVSISGITSCWEGAGFELFLHSIWLPAGHTTWAALCSGKCVKRWHEKIIRVANMIEDLLLPGTVLSGPKAQILCEGGSVPLRKRQARVLVIIMYCSGCCRWREGG